MLECLYVSSGKLQIAERCIKMGYERAACHPRESSTRCFVVSLLGCCRPILQEVVKVQYEESEHMYTVSCLQQDCPVLINDVLLGVDERRPVDHGDIWRIGQHVFVAHIHHGSISFYERLLESNDK